MTRYFSKIFEIIGLYKKYLPGVFLLSFVAMGLELVGLSLIIPYIAILKTPETLYGHEYWQRFVAPLGVQEGREALIFMSAVLFGVYTLKTIFNVLVQRSILNFSYNLQAYLRDKFSALYLYAPYLFHTRKRSNEVITVLQSHISQFSKGIVASLLQISAEIITLVAILLFLLIGYPVPSITAFLVLGVFALVYDRLVKRQLQQYGQDLIDASNDQMKAVRHGIQSLKEVRVLGRGAFFQSAVAEVSFRASRINAIVAVLQMIPRYILELLIVGIVIVSAIMMLLTGNDGEQVVSGLAVFAVAAMRLLPSAVRIVSNIGNLRYGQTYLDEMYGDFTALSLSKGAIVEPMGAEQVFNTLSLSDIYFSYPDSSHAILRGLNFALEKGEIVGLCGVSGSGKSTLVDIILGLLKADNGRAIVNGKDVGLNCLSQYIRASYIPQKPILLDDTLRRNIAIGVDDADIEEDKVLRAIEKAQLGSVINGLEGGLDANIGEDGILLSGGQRQRIALARSFYFGRDLIVFDEATSALDKDTENEILKAIAELRGEATILFISHNDQPLQICDRICYLENGKLMEKKK